MINRLNLLFLNISKEDICDYKGSTEHELGEGSTVHDLIDKQGLPLEAIKIIFLNGEEVDTDTSLHNGDQLGYL